MEMSADVVVVGAGPSGLSCAIEAKNAGLGAIVLEKGSIVEYIRRFPANLVWFSTPELLEIGGVPFVISSVRPTRVDTLNYYRKVVSHHGLDVRCFDAVSSIRRAGARFEVRTARGALYSARFVVLATGYFDNPNRLGVKGEDLSHVSHYYDEPFMYAGSDVVVVGGRNSAVEAALDLYRHGARVRLVHRGERLSEGVKYWILPDIENRFKAGEIQASFRSTVVSIEPGAVNLQTPDGPARFPAGFVFILIGFHPDIASMREFGIDIDPETLAPRHDPLTLETNIPGLYVAGSAVAGKFNNKIFVENGRLHGGVIVSAMRAADRAKP
ncbi:MAG TPA: YpdA family putative bacillithiol disulfide reductase [Bacteroidota bacterium]|nr:YpdA family putative bacillithiol disulfide reductase [Bacteroidota bacterium]